MTNEEMRVAIAEAVGWKLDPACTIADHDFPDLWVSPNSFEGTWNLPDYPGDLDAIQSAESTMSVEQWRKWTGIVQSMLFFADHHGNPKSTLQMIAELTAAQRCEALCRTLFPERFKP